MLPFITLDSLSFRAPDGRTLLNNVTLAFGAERTGLVGANGCGKTTLLRLILGDVTPSAGSVAVRGRVGLLRQSFAPPPGASLADLLGVADAFARLDRIEAGAGSADDFERADWDLPQRVAAAMADVGLGAMALARDAGSLSGGEATRAAVARLLIEAPDMMLLDEPTNNLDADARAMIADVLSDWRGGALVVSHDRSLLRGMDRIVELSSLGARLYGGGYDLYRQRKDEEADAAARALDSAERDARRIDREIQATRERQDRSDAAGRRAKARGDQPKIILNAMAGRAENTRAAQQHLADRRRADAEARLAAARERVEIARRLGFDLPPSGLAAGKLALAFEEVTFGWPGVDPLFENLSFRITGPERLAVSGRNGAGKSTLIALALGQSGPTAGRITRGVATLALDQRAALLHDDETLVQNYRRLNPAATDNQAHAALARFLFRNVAALKPAGALSGGERLRAALACVLLGDRPPQLVILDEPTNHLDLDSIEAVETALSAYDGALLIVSHDEDFLQGVGVERRLQLGR
jgi:ATPase subunit of ABC transporter with duplicated ATPase domains